MPTQTRFRSLTNRMHLVGMLYMINEISHRNFSRPPNSEASKWEHITYSMEKSKDTNINNIIITMYFNCNLNNTRDSKIRDIICDQGMSKLIFECTHFIENSATLLDLILVNNEDMIKFFQLSGTLFFRAI